jgi:hypothetical protein
MLALGTRPAEAPLALALLLASAAASPTAAAADAPFRIECVDSATGRGVPLVQLTTSGYISYYSDSAGVVAFDESGLLGASVFFMVRADGYVNADQMTCGYQRACAQPGVLLRTRPGGKATITLTRTQPAERLYRLTGGGLYRDTVLVGDTPPVEEPLLSSAGVLGQDSLMAVAYKNQTRLFFGDTECPQGPRNSDCQNYGKFTTGATAALGVPGSQAPSLKYYTSTEATDPGGMAATGRPNATEIAEWNPESFPHPRAMLAGPGRPIRNYEDNTWVGSLTVIREVTEERMYLTYVCPNTQLQGLALWDDGDEVFKPVSGEKGYDMRYSGAQWVQLLKPGAEEQGYAYYASAFASVRVRATFNAIEDPAAYEVFTPCGPQGACNTTMGEDSWEWHRGSLGKPGAGAAGRQYVHFGPQDEAKAIKAGWLPHAAARMQTVDRATGKPLVGLSRGSVNWNAHRNAYVLIADQSSTSHQAGNAGSPSKYGELFYCEAPTITGPWRECDRIITHNVTGASCYNPMQLPWLDEGQGKVIYLACTWTSMSSGIDGPTDRVCDYDMYGGQHCAVAVPRYEYNNLVFRLDVDRDLRRGAGGLHDA